MLIDLHTHSNASDGSFSPQDLVDHAIKSGVGVLALCDHDTTAGLKKFTSYGIGKDCTVIAGVELSATWEKGNCHILGLGVREDYQPLESILQQIRDSRDYRNVKIINKLHGLGVELSIEEVENLAGGDVVARPHIALALVNKGYVTTVKDAFNRYLAKGAPAYVDRYRLEPEKAVEILRDAGASPVLAHPSQLNRTVDDINDIVEKLKKYGLAGLEVYTPYTLDEDIGAYCTLAENNSLFVTGGSDFHGASKPDHFLGYYRKDRVIPEECAKFFI